MNTWRIVRYCLGICALMIIFVGSIMQPLPIASAHFLIQSDPTVSPHPSITRNVNIRSEPTTSAPVLTVAHPGESYLITGQTSDGSWWRIDYNGQPAWLFANLVQVDQKANIPVVEANAVPVLLPAPTSTASGKATAIVIKNVNVRSGPSTSFDIIASAQANQRFPITGKNANGSWWRIDYKGQAAWIFANLVLSENVEGVAVVDTPTAPAGAGSASPQAVQFDPQLVQFRLEPIIAGLSLPTHITNAGDGSGRFFVVERAGRIRIYPGPQSEGQIFLEIEDRVGDSGPEQGMFSVAFPPNFSSTGYFFVNYTNNDGNTVIARYQVSDNANRADRDSEVVVLFLKQPARNHNGGMLLFGPDGNLWIGMGDGGGTNDTFQNGQNPGSLLGKMLRINVTSNPSQPYTIPPDNPWVTATWNGQEVSDEIWAIGLRNPWRYSFDRRTGDFWIADVGESMSEEIDYIPAAQVRQGGFNFGWPIMEGPHCLNAAGCSTVGLTLPAAEYGHAGNGCSITGGYVYRGQAFPQIDGVYFFADYCSGNIWAHWRTTSGEAQTTLILPKAAAISSFGEDEAGELYATDIGGGLVYRLVVAEATANAQR